MRKINTLRLSELLNILKDAGDLSTKQALIDQIHDLYKEKFGDEIDPRTIKDWFKDGKLKRKPKKLTSDFLCSLIESLDTKLEQEIYHKNILWQLQYKKFELESIRDLSLPELSRILANSVLLPENYIPQDENTMEKNSNQDNNSPSTIVSPNVHFLTSCPGMLKLIHREQELLELENLITESPYPVLINGMGGIGKSAIAAELFRIIESKFDCVGWVHYEGNLRDSLLSDITVPWIENEKKVELRIASIRQLLKSEDHDCLLFIDNADQEINNDFMFCEMMHWPKLHLVLTSRCEYIDGSALYHVGPLKEDYCIDLFYSYYGYQNRSEEDSVRKLVSWANFHTLTIDLLARAAKRESGLQKFYEKLSVYGFDAAKLTISTEYDNRKAVIKEHLRVLFDFSGLNKEPELQRILWNFAYMPPINISADVENWICADVNDLDKLVQFGWLSWREFGDSYGYYMHPLISEIILWDKSKIPTGTFDIFINCLTNRIVPFIPSSDGYDVKAKKIEIVEHFLAMYTVQDTEICLPIHVMLALAANDIGDAQKAIYYMKKNMEISKVSNIANIIDIINSQTNLGFIYKENGFISEAEEQLENALELADANSLKVDADILAAIYSNLGDVYLKEKKFTQAIAITKKSLNLFIENYGTQDIHTALLHNNLGAVYEGANQLKQAMEQYEKALPIFLSLVGEENPYTAICYHNIAKVYSKLLPHSYADDQSALEFDLLAYKIFYKLNGPEHPHTIVTKDRIHNYYTQYCFNSEPFEEWLKTYAPL